MEMTFQQYIDNPMGKRNAVFSQRDMYKRMYSEKFDMLFLREAGRINFTMYIDEEHDRWIIHIKVPSETVKKFYYDAVIMFYSNSPSAKTSSSLSDYYVKFFSNDPAFVFTYLRVFLKNNLFFEDLESKASKLALEKDPNITNPYQVPGYSKILYFAFLFMKTKNLFSKTMFRSYGNKYNKKDLLNTVEHADTKIAERQRLGNETAKELAKQKKQEKESNNTRNTPSTNRFSSNGNNIKTTSNVGTVKSTKGVSTTKKTNKVGKK